MIDARIPVALGASLMLQGGALALPDGPRAQSGEPFGARAFQARLRPPAAEAVLASSHRAAAPRGAGATRGAVLPGAAPKYYPARELDQRPLVRTAVHPVFPQHAPVDSGRVVLRLLISASGEVDEARVLSASPPGVFDAAALEAFTPAQFLPGRRKGVAVGSALNVELLFGRPLPAVVRPRHADLPKYEQPRRPYRQRSTPPQEKP